MSRIEGVLCVALYAVMRLTAPVREAVERLRTPRGCQTDCAACGRAAKLEDHHPARASADPNLTVGLCPPCHRIVTRWQDAVGMPVHRKPPSNAERERAGLVGLLHVAQLQRFQNVQTADPDLHLPRILARLFAAMSGDGLTVWTPSPLIPLSRNATGGPL